MGYPPHNTPFVAENIHFKTKTQIFKVKKKRIKEKESAFLWFVANGSLESGGMVTYGWMDGMVTRVKLASSDTSRAVPDT